MDLEKIIIKTLIEHQFGDNLKNGDYITGVKMMYFGEVAASVVDRFNKAHASKLYTAEDIQEAHDIGYLEGARETANELLVN